MNPPGAATATSSNPAVVLGPIVRAVAAYGLTATGTELPREPLDDDDWAALTDRVLSERLEGHLAQAVTDGAFPVTAAQAEEAAVNHIRAMALAVTLERVMLEAADVLEKGSIEFRVLKGSAIAHLDYPDPSARAFGDVDLLVRSEQYDDAAAALVASGCRRRMPEPRPGFDRRFGKGAVFVCDGGFEIDLHRTFASGPFGMRVRLEDVWRHSVSFSVGGRELAALDDVPRFLHVCYHAVLGDRPPKLNPQRDLAEMLQAQDVDIDAIRALSAAWRGDAVVAQAIRLIWESFALGDVNALSCWAKDYRPSRRERSDLAASTGPHSSYVTTSLAGVRAVPGWRLKAAYLWALGVPSRKYLREQGTTAGARWWHGLDRAIAGNSDA